MPNIGVKSPFFIPLSEATANSFKIEVTVGGTLRYTLIKKASAQAGFDVSELIRDYIDIEYSGALSSTPETDYSVEVSIAWSTYTSDDATGTAISSGTITHDAYDGYAFFEEEDAHFEYPSTAVLLSGTELWYPKDTSGEFYYVSSGTVGKQSFSSTATSVSVAGTTVTIDRSGCTKHDAKKIVFINRYGLPQELWFFGKTTEGSSFTNDRYKSSNIGYDGSFSKYEHQRKTIFAQGKTRYTLNTGLVGESYNDFIRELLLSDQVWLHTDSTVRPVIVTSSDIIYRTSLNDKMIQYAIELEEANDLISNMR